MLLRRWTTKAGYKATIRSVEWDTFEGERHCHLCGYVLVPENHPWFGKAYGARSGFAIPEDEPIGDRGAISVFCMSLDDDAPTNARIDLLIDVHGSITYAGYEWEAKDEWCFGFDCNHYRDTPEYWTEERVAQECERLAEQLKRYEGGK